MSCFASVPNFLKGSHRDDSFQKKKGWYLNQLMLDPQLRCLKALLPFIWQLKGVIMLISLLSFSMFWLHAPQSFHSPFISFNFPFIVFLFPFISYHFPFIFLTVFFYCFVSFSFYVSLIFISLAFHDQMLSTLYIVIVYFLLFFPTK